MRNASTQDFLKKVIRGAVAFSCQDCGRNPCPRHAAEAVLDACRREDLFVMESYEAEQVLEDARSEAVAAGYAEAVRRLRDDNRYANAPEHLRRWNADVRHSLAAYLEYGADVPKEVTQ